MQILLRPLLTLCLAHLLADFVFQPSRLVEQKRRGKLFAYLLHGLIHYCCAVLLTWFFIRGSILSLRAHIVIPALVLVHLLIDAAKIELTRRSILSDGSRAYVLDQLIHLATLIIAARLVFPAPPGIVGDLLQRARSLPNKFLAVPVVYVAIVFGGGYLIRLLTRSLSEDVKSHSHHESNAQLQNAGLYIGWIERFLMLTAILLQSPATVGLILTAKAIARFPEFKSERFAEYFLIGTLLSIAMAIAGGVFLAKLIFGQVRFA